MMMKLLAITLAMLTLVAAPVGLAQTEANKAAQPEPKTVAESLKAVQEYQRQRVLSLRSSGQPIDFTAIMKEKVDLARKYAARFPLESIQGAELIALARLQTEAQQPSLAQAALSKALTAPGSKETERADTLLAGVEIAITSPVTEEALKQAESYAAQLDAMGDSFVQKQIAAHSRLGGYYRAVDTDEKIAEHEHKFLLSVKKLSPAEQKQYRPRSAQAYVNLAEVYAGREDNDKALSILRDGLREMADEPKSVQQLRGAVDRYSLVGKPAAPILADSWLNAESGPKPVGNQLKMGGRVTLLEFTAHWCGPCRKSYPTILRLHKGYSKEGLEVVFATELYGFFERQAGLKPADELAADQKYFVEHHGLPFKVGVLQRPASTGTEDAKRNPNDENYFVNGIPQIVVIDKQGIVRMIMIGWDPTNESRLAHLIERLLKEPGRGPA